MCSSVSSAAGSSNPARLLKSGMKTHDRRMDPSRRFGGGRIPGLQVHPQQETFVRTPLAVRPFGSRRAFPLPLGRFRALVQMPSRRDRILSGIPPPVHPAEGGVHHVRARRRVRVRRGELSRNGAVPVDLFVNIFYSFVNEQFLFTIQKNKNYATGGIIRSGTYAHQGRNGYLRASRPRRH